jgi:hypothetical protein
MLKCDVCGKFMDRIYDEGTYYGSPKDCEPPDPVCYCKYCAKINMKVAMYKPELIVIGCWWRKPDYVLVAKSILRHRKKYKMVAKKKD